MSNDNGKRIMPDKPGWWWCMGNHGPFVEEVDGDQNHALFLAIDGSGVVDDGSWLAPIPGPEVCAALAKYGAAVDDLDALWDGADFITRNNVTNLAHAAGDALDVAIRAERDGGA